MNTPHRCDGEVLLLQQWMCDSRLRLPAEDQVQKQYHEGNDTNDDKGRNYVRVGHWVLLGTLGARDRDS